MWPHVSVRCDRYDGLTWGAGGAYVAAGSGYFWEQDGRRASLILTTLQLRFTFFFNEHLPLL